MQGAKEVYVQRVGCIVISVSGLAEGFRTINEVEDGL